MPFPFFQIKKNEKISYVLGTFHYLPFDSLPTCIQNSISQVNFLVVESAYKRTIEDLYRLDILTHQEDDFWTKALSETALEAFQGHIETLCRMKQFPLFSFKQINPNLAHWVVRFAQQNEGMDHYLKNRFPGYLGLGDPVDVLKNYVSLMSMSIEELDNFITSGGELNSESIDPFKEIYFSNDLFTKEEYLLEYEEDIEGVVNRNIKWIPRLIELHETLQGSVLFSVGVGHLTGLTGLLQLLKNYGFDILQMNSEGYFESYQAYTSGHSIADLFRSMVSEYLEYVIEESVKLKEQEIFKEKEILQNNTQQLTVKLNNSRSVPTRLIVEYLVDTVQDDPSMLSYFNLKRSGLNKNEIECHVGDGYKKVYHTAK